jgi:uncharacterized protein YfaS (alpha-2-macroglobulin family)
MKSKTIYALCLTILFGAAFLASGCGEKADMVAQMNGAWESKDNGVVKLNLTGERKSVEINGAPVAVNITEINKDQFTLFVQPTDQAGSAETWSFRQVWEDNGNSFTIEFVGKGGRRDMLVKRLG